MKNIKIKKVERKINKIVSKMRKNNLQREILKVKLDYANLDLARLERLNNSY